jgi:hypothetical protein
MWAWRAGGLKGPWLAVLSRRLSRKPHHGVARQALCRRRSGAADLRHGPAAPAALLHVRCGRGRGRAGAARLEDAGVVGAHEEGEEKGVDARPADEAQPVHRRARGAAAAGLGPGAESERVGCEEGRGAEEGGQQLRGLGGKDLEECGARRGAGELCGSLE